MSPPVAAGLIYAGLFVVTCIYAVILEYLHSDPQRTYEPDWTWLTVVIGNALIGIAFLLLCLYTPPAAPVGYFWTLFFCNVVAGIPIIAWQLWQRSQRPAEALRRKRPDPKEIP